MTVYISHFYWSLAMALGTSLGEGKPRLSLPLVGGIYQAPPYYPRSCCLFPRWLSSSPCSSSYMRQITLFLMTTPFPENILNKIAFHILTTVRDSTQSWFINIKKLCYQYNLPHPLLLLQQPPEMTKLKKYS